MKRKFYTTASFVLFLSMIGFSQIPRMISIQGVLTDGDGNVLADGSYDLTLSLYITPEDAEFVWTESHTAVSVTNGVFNVVLGSVNELGIAFDQPYFVGIRVGDDPEMLPRIPFTASPYSLFALDVGDSAVTSGSIVANAVTADKIEPDVISSLNGVRNDAGNINLVAGASMSITSNDTTDEIVLSVIGGNGAIGQIDEGDGIDVSNPNGPAVRISVEPKSIGSSELEADVTFGPNGSVQVQNTSGIPVALMTVDSLGNGSMMVNGFDRSNGIGLRINDDGGYLTVNDDSGNERIRLFADDQGNGFLTTLNNTGMDAVRIASTTQGYGFVVTNNIQGALTAGMTGNSLGGYMFVTNPTGLERVRMNTVASGEGHLGVDNDLGLEVAEVSSVQGMGYIATYNNAANLTGLLTSLSTGGSLTLYDDTGDEKGAMYVDAEGGGYLVLNNANSDATIILDGATGDISSNSRIVLRSAMLDASNGIFHTALEGPEAGTYYRGTGTLVNGEAVIPLPDHFATVASSEGMTVQLTPHSQESEGLAVTFKSPQEIRVKELRKGKGNYEFDYIVHAIHKAYADFKVVQDMDSTRYGRAAGSKDSAEQFENRKIKDQIVERK